MRRMENAQASLSVSIGRIPGTAMPTEWAASGAKLGFALDVGFARDDAVAASNDRPTTSEGYLRRDAMMGNAPRTILPLNRPSFVSASGEEWIDVMPGAYGCQAEERGGDNRYSFRWSLDFPGGARRNDVELPAERVYFLSRCWIVPDPSGDESGRSALERAMKEKERVLSDIELTNARFDKIRNTPPAGTLLGDVVQSAFNARHMVVLVERRKSLQSRLDELVQKYPLDANGIVDGPNGVTFAKEGVVAVKRSRQYHWIGTFSINEFS